MKSKTKNAGPVGTKPRGEWKSNYNDGNGYSILEEVLHNHDSWVSKVNANKDEPSESSAKWQRQTKGGQHAYEQGEAAKEKATAANTLYQTIKTWWEGASGFKSTAESWLSTSQTNFTNWFSDTLATGVRKLWNNFWADINSKWTGFWGTSATDANGVRKQWADLKADAQSATNTALEAATEAESKGNAAALKGSTAESQGNAAEQKGNAAAVKGNTAEAQGNAAENKGNTAEQKGNAAETKGNAAAAAASYAELLASNPPRIGATLPGHQADDLYWYYAVPNEDHTDVTWMSTGIWSKGDNLDWNDLTAEERQAVVDAIRQSATFASVELCESAIDELN